MESYGSIICSQLHPSRIIDDYELVEKVIVKNLRFENVELIVSYAREIRVTGSYFINSKVSVRDLKVDFDAGLDVLFKSTTFLQSHFSFVKCEILQWYDVVVMKGKSVPVLESTQSDFREIDKLMIEHSIMDDQMKITMGNIVNITGTSFGGDSSLYISQISHLFLSNSLFSDSVQEILPMLIITFVNEVDIRDCIVERISSQWLYVSSIFHILMMRLNVIDCKVKGNIMFLTSTNNIYVKHSHFRDNYGTVINMANTVTLELKNSTFNNCHSNIHESIVILNSNEAFSQGASKEKSYIWGTNFTKCSGWRGGALYLNSYYKVDINGCQFVSNSAEKGSAVFFETHRGMVSSVSSFEPTLTIFHSVFLENGDPTFGSLSSGGAIFVKGSIYIYASSFINNYALKGGAVYIQQSDSTFFFRQYNKKFTALLVRSQFYNNTADFGEIIFSELTNTELVHFYLNKAIFGPTSLGSPCTKLQYENLQSEREHTYNGTLMVYMGEKVSFDLLASNLYGYVFPKPYTLVGIKAPETSKVFVKTLDDEDNIESQTFNKSFSLYSHYEITNHEDIVIKVVYEKVVLTIGIVITPCPLFYKWESPVCVNVFYLIPTVVSITLLMMVVGLAAIVACCIARNRTKRWNTRKNAERIMEQALLDKRVIFEEDEQSSNGNNLNRPFIISAEDIVIVKKIGEGGAANVFLAKWKGQEVAIKTLKECFKGDTEVLETEAALISSFLHPNVIRFWGFCASSSQKYMVMEYMKGGSLEKLIQNCKTGKDKLTFYEKVKILLGVAKGMAYLHGLKPCCVHRDLKPGNILLDEIRVSKVGDFGLSRLISNTYQTSFTTNVGTLFYMAPENFSDNSFSEDSLGMSGFSHTTYHTNVTNTQNSVHSYYSEAESVVNQSTIQESESSEKKLMNASKVDVYSFAVIMWSLFFEESPYGNYNTKKMNLFGDINDNYTNCYTVLPLILQGKRPTVPFNSVEKMKRWLDIFVMPKETIDREILSKVVFRYLNMMKLCWHPQPEERPPFDQIVPELEDFAKQLLV